MQGWTTAKTHGHLAAWRRFGSCRVVISDNPYTGRTRCVNVARGNGLCYQHIELFAAGGKAVRPNIPHPHTFPVPLSLSGLKPTRPVNPVFPFIWDSLE